MKNTLRAETKKKRGRPPKSRIVDTKLAINEQEPTSNELKTLDRSNSHCCCGKGNCFSEETEQTFFGKIKLFFKRLVKFNH